MRDECPSLWDDSHGEVEVAKRERSWCLVQHGARRKLDVKRLIRFSFSMGSEAWNWLVSSVIPRNSRDVEGPSVFSADRGTPRLEKTD